MSYGDQMSTCGGCDTQRARAESAEAEAEALRNRVERLVDGAKALNAELGTTIRERDEATKRAGEAEAARDAECLLRQNESVEWRKARDAALAQVREMRAALEPFTAMGWPVLADTNFKDECVIFLVDGSSSGLTIGHFRNAAKALSGTPGEPREDADAAPEKARWFFTVDKDGAHPSCRRVYEWPRPTMTGADVRAVDRLGIPSDNTLHVSGAGEAQRIGPETAVRLSSDRASPTDFFTAPPATFLGSPR